jgi:hypothetical protein
VKRRLRAAKRLRMTTAKAAAAAAALGPDGMLLHLQAKGIDTSALEGDLAALEASYVADVRPGIHVRLRASKKRWGRSARQQAAAASAHLSATAFQ